MTKAKPAKPARSINDLPDYVETLGAEDRGIFDRLFELDKVTGTFKDDPETRKSLKKFFDGDDFHSQEIVKVFNKVTYEGTLYNSIRARRPVKMSLDPKEFEKALGSAKRDFEYVPEDVFGAVHGRHSSTSANIAKYDEVHSLVIFNDSNPLDFDREEIKDYFDTAIAWFHKAYTAHPEAKYPMFIWNCLWKSGGSIVHGHAQVLLSKRKHYAKVEYLRHMSHEYEKQYVANYFSDLHHIHKALGLGMELDGVRVMAYLTAIKEKELMIFTPKVDENFTDILYDILQCYINELGVSSFNLSMALPPFKHTDERWGHFPAVIRIVDRGNPLSKISDIGAMELYAASVVASDPFQVMAILKEKLTPEATG
jgi:hypothetical protein